MKTRDRLTLQTVLVAIIVIVAVVYALFIRPNFYNFNGGKIDLEPVYSENFSTKDAYKIYNYNDYLYLSSKNGLKKISMDHESIWDKTFYMEDPQFLSDKGFMAVVDLGGKQVFVFNEEGLVMEIKVDYPIILANISSSGALVLIEETENKHLIQLYNRKGVLYAERGTHFNTDGYPIAVDISSTGEKMVTSYLSVQEGVVKSNITFFSFESESLLNPDNILGGFVLEGSMAAEVKFLDNEHVAVICDNSLTFYNLKGSPKVETQIKLDHKIDLASFNNQNLIICYGDPIIASKETTKNRIKVYSFEGKVVDEYTSSNEVRYIAGEGEHYYLITEASIEYRNAKKLVWETPMQKDVKNIMKIGKDKYVIVLQQGYEIDKIKDI